MCLPISQLSLKLTVLSFKKTRLEGTFHSKIKYFTLSCSAIYGSTLFVLELQSASNH